MSAIYRSEPLRCKVGDKVLIVDGTISLAGQIGTVAYAPIEDVSQEWRTAAEVSLAFQHDWVVEVLMAPKEVKAYGRLFQTNLFLLNDSQLLPLGEPRRIARAEQADKAADMWLPLVTAQEVTQ